MAVLSVLMMLCLDDAQTCADLIPHQGHVLPGIGAIWMPQQMLATLRQQDAAVSSGTCSTVSITPSLLVLLPYLWTQFQISHLKTCYFLARFRGY